MSIFTVPVQPAIHHADLVIALALLSMMILKVVTMQQQSPLLLRLNRYVTVSMYPMGMIFGLLLLQWVMI